MKKHQSLLLTIALLLISSSIVSAMQRTVVCGKVTNPKGQEIVVAIVTNPLVTGTLDYKSAIDAEGNFHISFDQPVAIPAKLKHGRSDLPIFLEPGDSLFVTVDAKMLTKSVIYSGGGYAHNQFIIDSQNTFDAKGENFENHREVKARTANDFQQYVKDLKQKRYDYFASHEVNTCASPNFRAYHEIKLEHDAAIALLKYPALNARYNKNASNTPVAANYFDFLKDMSLNNESAMLIPSYVNFLDAYTANKLSQEKMQNNKDYDFDDYYADKYAYAAKLLTGKAQYFVKAKSVVEGFSNGRVEKVIPQYQDFMQTNPYPEYKQVVGYFFESLGRLAAGNPAPNFTVYDINGKQVQLSDYKGKVVYLDFWATWCGPCKKEIPHSKILKDKMKGKDVVFLYISTDKDFGKWESFVAKEKLGGIQTIAKENKQAVSDAYYVTGIPKFILIDKDGKIANSKAKRPSDPKAAAHIMDLLN